MDESGDYCPPTISEEGDLILGAGSVQDENRVFAEGLASTHLKVIEESTHYFGRAAQYNEVDWTDCMNGTIMQANYRHTSLSHLGDAARIKNGASVAFYVPPSDKTTQPGAYERKRHPPNRRNHGGAH